MQEDFFKIGELSQITGCKIDTIRFFEKEGLLSNKGRTQGNHRIYGRGELERLQTIMDFRENGMKLECIKQILSAFEKEDTNKEDLLKRILEYKEDALRRIARIEKAIKKLNELEDKLQKNKI